MSIHKANKAKSWAGVLPVNFSRPLKEATLDWKPVLEGRVVTWNSELWERLLMVISSP